MDSKYKKKSEILMRVYQELTEKLKRKYTGKIILHLYEGEIKTIEENQKRNINF